MSNVLLEILGKGFDHVQRIVDRRYLEVELPTILNGERRRRRKMTGHLLHIKRATPQATKILTRTKTKADYINVSSTYYRMLYVRFGMSMSVIIIRQDEVARILHAENRLSIGGAITVLEPQCDSEWNNLPIIKTEHPLFPASAARQPLHEVIPQGLIGSGDFASFCMTIDRITIISVNFIAGCNHEYCDARYGENCPRSISRELCRMTVPQVCFEVPDINGKWAPYASKALALAIFSAELLVAKTRKDVDYLEMESHMAEALENHRGFSILGWYRPHVTKDDVVTETCQLHTTLLTVIGGPLQRYDFVPGTEVGNEPDGAGNSDVA